MPVITLLTDYGLDDEFVGVCHGVIARICPDARIIDLTHGIARHDVRAGALALAHALPYLPVGVHVAIVDPGVGGTRRAVALSLSDGRKLVGPDNGLLWPAIELAEEVTGAVEISNSHRRLEPVSATFHGRDIFCPVAAALAAGDRLEDLGEELGIGSLVRIDLPEPRVDDGVMTTTVIGVDGFGNAQLGVPAAYLEQLGLRAGAPVRLESAAGKSLVGVVGRTFGDVAPGECILLEDGAGQLSIAVNTGSAAAGLRLQVGDELRIGRP